MFFGIKKVVLMKVRCMIKDKQKRNQKINLFKAIHVPGVQMPPTEFLRGLPTYARPKIPPSNFKSVKRCARQKSL